LGLTGGYYGGFTTKPYYDIINTYNNIENRDIWEFNLNFTPKSLIFLWRICGKSDMHSRGITFLHAIVLLC
jgi:hypothetical protein